MRYRDWLHRRGIRENSSIDWDIYKSARNKVTSDLRRAKTTYYHRLCSSNIHPAQLWKQLNNLLCRKNNCAVKSMVVNNRELTDKTEIAEAMNSHFIHAASPSTTPPHHLNPGTDPKPFFSLSPVTEDEVIGIVLSLDPNKSSGPSDINAKCLQLTISSIVTPIVRIINLSQQNGTVPSCWKAANVTPVFKKGDKQDPTNYRPISVIPVLGKTLERVMYTRLMTFLSENNILTPFQSGFRPNHSTEDVLIRTVEGWRQEVDQGKAIAAVFIDFSKAFDSIAHPLLLTKLQSIGVNNKALDWFKDYLTNRRQRVVVDGHVSSWSLVQQGVPQGSLLGPLLFSIYTNDMPSCVSTSSINMYADDTALYASDNNAIVAAKRVTDYLSAIHSWCRDNHLLINQTMTLAMFLSRNNTKQRTEISQAAILLDGSPLRTVSEFRYLGVLLDSNLSFKSHINSITS